jgi:hypothetical protein
MTLSPDGRMIESGAQRSGFSRDIGKIGHEAISMVVVRFSETCVGKGIRPLSICWSRNHH